MKSRILALIALFMWCVVSVMAQSPGRFNYQAVVRDASNNSYTNQDVGIRFNILNSSLVSVYTETQLLTTNNLGLVNTTIGDVNPTAFDAVEWGSDEYLLKIELDLGDNGSWETEETRALNSVPYALHAETAGRILGDSIWKKTGDDTYYNQGNIGIGVSSPQYPLHIVSNQITGRDTMIYIQTADDPASALILGNGTVSDGKYMPSIIGINGSDHRQSLFMIAQTTEELDDHAGYPLITFNARKVDGEIINRPLFQWSNYASAKMTLAANGNLGIGTNTPATKLHIDGGSDVALLAGNGYLQIGATDGPNLVFDDNEIMARSNNSISELYLQHDGGNLYVGRNSTSLVVKDDGNVGIGTLSPTEKLSVRGVIESTMGGIKFPDGSIQIRAKTTYSVGDFAQGGIVFWLDYTGQHGLVCTVEDQSTGVRWYAGTQGYTRANGDGSFAGEANTSIIIAAHVAIGDDGDTYAARICNELKVNSGIKTYGDWYLPSKEELNLMYQNRGIINGTAAFHGGSNFSTTTYYWSSTEAGIQTWVQEFQQGTQGTRYKYNMCRVRAIRAF